MTRSLAIIIGCAIAYYLPALLSLALAIPPGFATPFWPAAGVAIVGTLLFGRDAAIGVFLGSLLVNATSPPGPLSGQGVVVASGIAVGAMAQAWVSAALIRRFVGFPTPMSEVRPTQLFLALAGPIGCVVSASLGSTSLLLGGIIDGSAWPISWLTWWFGDTLGALLVAPLVMSLVAEPRSVWRPRLTSVALPAVITLALVVLTYVYASKSEERVLDQAFQRRAAAVAEAFERSFREHVHVVFSVGALTESSPELDRLEFRRAVQHLLEAYPSIQALSWDPVVAHADRERYEERGCAELYPGFEFRERGPDGRLIRAADRDEYVVVLYIEPEVENAAALGFDIAADPVRREALDRSLERRAPTATAPIDLVQGPNETGLLVVMPSLEPGSRGARTGRAQARGFATSVLNVSKLAAFAFDYAPLVGISIDLTDRATGRTLYAGTTSGGAAPELDTTKEQRERDRRLVHVRPMTIGGRTWWLELRSTSEYLSARPTPRVSVVLWTGLLFAVALQTVLLLFSGRTYRIEQLAAKLEHSNVELEQALAKVKTLRGLLPICASCKSIRDDKGYWSRIEVYVRDHSDAEFTHGICPACRDRMYPELRTN